MLNYLDLNKFVLEFLSQITSPLYEKYHGNEILDKYDVILDALYYINKIAKQLIILNPSDIQQLIFNQDRFNKFYNKLFEIIEIFKKEEK